MPRQPEALHPEVALLHKCSNLQQVHLWVGNLVVLWEDLVIWVGNLVVLVVVNKEALVVLKAANQANLDKVALEASKVLELLSKANLDNNRVNLVVLKAANQANLDKEALVNQGVRLIP